MDKLVTEGILVLKELKLLIRTVRKQLEEDR